MKKLIIAAALLALGACSTLSTNSDYDPAVNFSQYKTYAWVESKGDPEAYQVDGLMDQRIRDAIDAEMAQKGFTKVAPDKAGVLVNYLTKVDKKIDVDTFNNNFGYYPYWGPGWRWGGQMQTQTSVREYQVGTLIVDLIDKPSGRLVWRGSAADTLRDGKTPQERDAKVREAVNSLMLQYPPKADAK